MKKFIFSLFALVLFTACDKENDEMLSPQQEEEQAYLNVRHDGDPVYPDSKYFKEGELRDVLVIMWEYGNKNNTHFVIRNVTHSYWRMFAHWQYFTIDDYDSRSYAKQNLEALDWTFKQSGHELAMKMMPKYWDVRTGDVGAFDNYPRMDIRIKPFGTVVRDCDLPPG
ncbi:hypothetical protein Barb4_04653 [Bacteroidales bacterium Barb4]|nr:hypothetical protein Barb4_04653 [Bacteroidales bacterium Barb4]